MRGKTVAVGALALAVIGSVAWFAARGSERGGEVAPASAAAPSGAASVPPPAASEPTATARTLPEIELAPIPNPARAEEHDFAAPSTVRGAAIPPAPTTSVFAGRDPLDPDDLAELLAEFGDWPGLYRVATEDERAELIVALSMQEEGVRGQFGGLLPLETNSELRAMMISRTDPEGFFDAEEEDPPVDEELIATLREQAATPVERDEWIARMQVATLTQEAFGIEMTRKALADHPDDPVVRLWASVLQLSLNRMVEGVEPNEAASAENFLFARLGSDGTGGFTAEQRIQGYSALVFASDPAVARDFLRDRIESEPDERAQATLRRLVAVLEAVAG